MVHSVLTVSSIDKVSRNLRDKPDKQEQKDQTPSSFSSIIKEKLKEQETAPRICRTVTYGNDSLLHLFQYQSKEYHY